MQLQRVVIDIGGNAKGHVKGGQFVQLKVGESKPGFYAIASPPDPNNQGIIELLIKNQGATSELLCSQPAGDQALKVEYLSLIASYVCLVWLYTMCLPCQLTRSCLAILAVSVRDSCDYHL